MNTDITKHQKAKSLAKAKQNNLPLKTDLSGTYYFNSNTKTYKYIAKGQRQPAKEKKINSIRLATKSDHQFLWINHKDYSVVQSDYYLTNSNNKTYIVFDYNTQIYFIEKKYSSQELTLFKYINPEKENN